MKRNILIVCLICLCALVMMGADSCSGEGGDESKSFMAESQHTEDNHATLVAAVPAPLLDTSLERVQLKKRLIRFNDENKISYIYLIDRGVIMAHYVIKGKVSSVNSKLTTQEKIVDDPWRYRSGGKVVESPALDGSYGTNGDAVFFYLAENDAYVEWNGTYLLFDQPMRMTTQPILVQTVN